MSSPGFEPPRACLPPVSPGLERFPPFRLELPLEPRHLRLCCPQLLLRSRAAQPLSLGLRQRLGLAPAHLVACLRLFLRALRRVLEPLAVLSFAILLLRLLLHAPPLALLPRTLLLPLRVSKQQNLMLRALGKQPLLAARRLRRHRLLLFALHSSQLRLVLASARLVLALQRVQLLGESNLFALERVDGLPVLELDALGLGLGLHLSRLRRRVRRCVGLLSLLRLRLRLCCCHRLRHRLLLLHPLLLLLLKLQLLVLLAKSLLLLLLRDGHLLPMLLLLMGQLLRVRLLHGMLRLLVSRLCLRPILACGLDQVVQPQTLSPPVAFACLRGGIQPAYLDSERRHAN